MRDPHAHRGTRAIERMVEHAPSTGGLALRLAHADLPPDRAGADAPPVSTDGDALYYAPSFDALPLDAQAGWIAHGVMHAALRHPQRLVDLRERLGDVDAVLFGVCADAIVDGCLADAPWMAPREGAVRLDGLLKVALGLEVALEAALLDWDVERLYREIDDRRRASPGEARAEARRRGPQGGRPSAGARLGGGAGRAGPGSGTGADRGRGGGAGAEAADMRHGDGGGPSHPPRRPDPSAAARCTSARGADAAAPPHAESDGAAGRRPPELDANGAAGPCPPDRGAPDAGANGHGTDAALRDEARGAGRGEDDDGPRAWIDGPRAERARALAGDGADDLLAPAGPRAPEDEAAQARDWAERLAAAHAGDGAFSMLRTPGADLPRSRTPWEQVLRVRLARALSRRPDVSWSRPSRSWLANPRRARRAPWEPGVLPGRAVPRVAVVVDVSGSVDAALLDRFAIEVEAIVRRLEAGVVLVVGDERVRRVETFEPGRSRLRGLELDGGGGTDFTPLLEEAARHRPDIAVVLTDLDGPARFRPPCPVIWAVPPTHRAARAPFGTTLALD